MDTNLISIPIETFVRLNSTTPAGGGYPTTIVIVVGMIIAALPAIGTLILAIRTATTVGKIETNTNSAASVLTTKVTALNEQVSRLLQDKATSDERLRGHDIAAGRMGAPASKNHPVPVQPVSVAEIKPEAVAEMKKPL